MFQSTEYNVSDIMSLILAIFTVEILTQTFHCQFNIKCIVQYQEMQKMKHSKDYSDQSKA